LLIVISVFDAFLIIHEKRTSSAQIQEKTVDVANC
jgi:hypothetical protein